MKARIVEWNKDVVEMDAALLVVYMLTRNVELVRFNHAPHQRDELQGHPVFRGWHGPMWDGGAIRYESPEAYEHYSA